jgi:hypothetical protein
MPKTNQGGSTLVIKAAILLCKNSQGGREPTIRGITPLWDLDFHWISTQHIKLAGKDCQGTVILNNYFAMHQIIVAAADSPPGSTSNDNSHRFLMNCAASGSRLG